MAKKLGTDPDAEEDVLIDNHEYDGIKEYDNPLPRWWTTLFWGSIVFSIGYLFHYHITGRGTSVADAYAQDIKAAEEVAASRALTEKVTEESLAKMASNSTVLATGQQVFKARCAACHGDQGEGKIGPNLTDDHWLHGNAKLLDLYNVIAEGVPAKGMPAWKKQLTPEELRASTLFVGSLRRKNLPGKAPEGKQVTAAP